jgi:hypothetical protein
MIRKIYRKHSQSLAKSQSMHTKWENTNSNFDNDQCLVGFLSLTQCYFLLAQPSGSSFVLPITLYFKLCFAKHTLLQTWDTNPELSYFMITIWCGSCCLQVFAMRIWVSFILSGDLWIFDLNDFRIVHITGNIPKEITTICLRYSKDP